MGSIIRNLKSFGGGLLGLAVMLIALFFILDWLSRRGWGPLSTLAGKAEGLANGSAYGGGGGVAVVGTPATPAASYGPHL